MVYFSNEIFAAKIGNQEVIVTLTSGYASGYVSEGQDYFADDDPMASSSIDFTFPSVELVPGEYVVVVQDIDAFERQYGDDLNVVGQYSGRLDNAGERIRLEDDKAQLLPSNPEHSIRVVPARQLEILGKLVGIIRKV